LIAALVTGAVLVAVVMAHSFVVAAGDEA